MVIQSDLNLELGPLYQKNNTLITIKYIFLTPYNALIVSEIDKIEYRYEIIVKVIHSQY